MQKKQQLKKTRKRPGLSRLLPLIPNYPNWITSTELSKSLDISSDRVFSWIAGIPETEPIALDDLSKGRQKYCYIRDSSGRILI